jgi:hypothetical protein
MLEIIKAYGLERLDQAGERDQLREAHAQYFIRLAEDQDNMHAAIGVPGAADAGELAAVFGSNEDEVHFRLFMCVSCGCSATVRKPGPPRPWAGWLI